jgi:peptidyl-prolyl cis-trans isomerase D
MIGSVMLDLMRRYAYSWTTRVILGLITVIFIFWGVGTGFFSTVHPIATVDGHRILADQVDREADRIKQTLENIYGANAAALLKSINLREEALDRIIENRLVNEEARRLGLRISTAELREKIASLPAFQVDGHFDFRQYQAVLRNSFNMFPNEYEAEMRAEMTQNLLRNMVSEAVPVSDSEARHVFDLRNERISLAYIEVPYQNYVAGISPTENQVERYYQEHQEAFREPERFKIDYIHYDPMVLAANFKPTDKQIEQFYQDNLKSRFTHPEEARASHILIRVSPTANPEQREQARKKAEEILQKLKKGADFAKLAKEYSQDPGSRDQGGDLGFFSREQMIKPFADQVFAMKPGQLRIIKTTFGYHVVRLEALRPARVDTIAEAKPRIIAILREAEGRRLAREALDQDISSALSGESLAAIARKRGLSVVETPFFSQAEAPGVVPDPKLVQEAVKLDKGQVRAVMGASAPYLVKLVDLKPSYIPPLKDIQERARQALIRSIAEGKARAQAEKLLSQIKEPADFDKIAQQNGLTVQKTGTFSRSGGTVPGIGSLPDVADAAATVPEVPGVIGRVMQRNGNAYIVEVLSRTLPAEREWTSAKKDFMQEYAARRQAEAWMRFVDALKAKAAITIDTNQLGVQAPSSTS